MHFTQSYVHVITCVPAKQIGSQLITMCICVLWLYIRYCSASMQGFTAELGASGSFCPQHVTLPVTTSFFSLSDDGGPSQYLVDTRTCIYSIIIITNK